MLKYVVSKGSDAIVLESDISFQLPDVSQIEPRPELGFGYAEVFRSIIRQEPDVILIDSLSDTETSKLALHASLSGKLILSGVYARSSEATLNQYVSLCQEPFLVASAVKLVINQVLVRKICENCKVEIRVSEETESRVKRELGTSHDLRFYKGTGCDKCKNGFKGRIPIFEILKPTSEIIDLITKGSSLDQIRSSAINSGMITMRQDGLLKAVSGLTTIDEVIKATRSLED